MNLPAHLAALLRARIAPPAAAVIPRDRTPQFTPTQSGGSRSSRVAAAVESLEFESHELDIIDNSENLILSVEQ